MPQRDAHALYVAQHLLEGEKYVTCSLVIVMIKEISESFKTTLSNFNTLQAQRVDKVLETVIIESCCLVVAACCLGGCLLS